LAVFEAADCAGKAAEAKALAAMNRRREIVLVTPNLSPLSKSFDARPRPALGVSSAAQIVSYRK
jgi:hypothetical protein